MQSSAECVKVSARIPKELMKNLSQIYPDETISQVFRRMIEREIVRQKALKAHLELYGRFKKEDFNESIL